MWNTFREGGECSYIAYGLLSGMYSYSLISFVVLFAYHVLRSYSPEWGWVPALGLGYLMLKGRIHALGRFMKLVFLDKKERVRAWFTGGRLAAVSALALILLLTPFWPDFVEGRFVLDPVQRAVVRAEVAGVVAQVPWSEGQAVNEGTPLVKLRNLQLESEAAKADADLRVAAARSTAASLHYAGLGTAERERQQAQERSRTLAEELAQLQITSPDCRSGGDAAVERHGRAICGGGD